MLYPDFDELLNLQHQAKKLQLRVRDQVTSPVSGDYKTKIYGSGLEFEGVREYVYGDDTRNIDWRVTARTGKTHSKLFSIESEQTVNIVVNLNPNMFFGTKSTFKSSKAAQIAALLGWYFNQTANRVGGLIFGKDESQSFKPTKTKQALLRFLQSLSERSIGKNYVPLHQILDRINNLITANSRIYVISDFANFDETKIAHDLSRFLRKGCNITFIQIIDEKDYQLPAIGTIAFKDNISGKKITIDTNSKAGREKYQQIWQENQQRLESLVNKSAITLVKIKTDDDAYLKLRQCCYPFA